MKEKREKVIIWGASENGRMACDYLDSSFDILFICDSDKKRWGEYLGKYVIKSPERVLDYPKAVVIIAVVKKYNSIISFLEKHSWIKIKHFISFYSFKYGKIKYRLIDIMPRKPFIYNTDLIEKDICRSKNKEVSKKRIAMVANYFPPIGGGGVQRPAKFAKFLKRMGYEPVIISKGYCDSFLDLDWTLLDELSDIQVIRILDEPISVEELSKDDISILCKLMGSLNLESEWIKRYFDDLWNRTMDIIPDQDIMWILSCIKTIEYKINIDEFSIVWTTIGPYSSALLGFYLKYKYGLKWVLDYRDPWCLNEYNMKTFYQFRLNRWSIEKELELALLKKTDYVTAASNEECKDFQEYNLNINACCITNGYDEDDFEGIGYVEKKHFEIVYNGFIYEHYEIVPFVELLTQMIEEGILEKDILFCINTTNSKRLSTRIRTVDKYNIVEINGYLSHRNSLERIMNANVLLVFGAYGEGAYGMYTGKIFEYLRSGIPVISFSSPYGVHYELIEMHGRGITTTMEDKDKIKKFISDIYRRWRLGCTVRYNIDDTYVKSFSREHLTNKLIDVIEKVGLVE